jgi:radical SAM superfamily enzyme YgiQ (UPF0313 family)
MKNMRFLFIFPPGRGFKIAAKKVFPEYPYSPPLGILYLSAMLERNGHTIEILDYAAENVDEVKLRCKIDSADAVGITIYSESLDESIYLAHIIKKHRPDISLLIGGPHCTLIPEKSLIDLNADICVIGDGELIICAIADALQGKAELSNIPGIYYKENKKIKQSSPAQIIKDLDSLPSPARHLVEKYEYGYFIGIKLSLKRTTSIITTRGCPYHCRFCGYNAIRSKYYERSVDNVINEIEEIILQGYRSIIIVDNNFLSDISKKRVEKIMDRIIEKKMKINISIMGARVDSADRRLYEKMRDAGVSFISFGIESGNQDVLELYDKRTTIQQIKDAINLSKQMGFFTSGSFIIGSEIETKNHIENTIKFAKSLPLDIAHFLVLGYQYGSPLWQKAVDEGKIKPDEFDVNADSKHNLGMFTAEEFEKYSIKAHRSFYYDPRYIIKQFFFAFRNRDFRILIAGFKMFITREI